jgi:hypothetical protein
MDEAIHKFIFAHERYLSLQVASTDCIAPASRELMHIELMKAYLEVQYRAKVIAGLQYADGNDFADAN